MVSQGANQKVGKSAKKTIHEQPFTCAGSDQEVSAAGFSTFQGRLNGTWIIYSI